MQGRFVTLESVEDDSDAEIEQKRRLPKLTICLLATLFLFATWLLVNCILDPPHISIQDKSRVHACGPHNVTVIGWNLFLMYGKPSLHERTQLIADKIGQYDIMLFTEAWNLPLFSPHWWTVRILKKTADERGFNMLSNFRGGARFQDSGLTIITHYEIMKHDFIVFTHSHGIDSLASKGALYAKLKISENHVLHCFVTHLNAKYRLKDTVTGEVRKKQYGQLLDWIQSLSSDFNPEDRVVVFGDFNVNRNEQQELIDSFTANNFKTMDDVNGTTAFSVYNRHGKGIDLIPDMYDIDIPEEDTVEADHLDWMFYRDREHHWKTSIEIMSPSAGSGPHKFKALSDHRAVTAEIPVPC